MGIDIKESDAELPACMIYLWDLHQEMRLSKAVINGENKLIARDKLTLDSVINYLKYNNYDLNKIEINAILSIDSIMEYYSNGNG